nr:antibiotic biosynthesis monooxygenase [Lysinibacillus contaminans]
MKKASIEIIIKWRNENVRRGEEEVVMIVRWESEEAWKAWGKSPEHIAAIKIRLKSTVANLQSLTMLLLWSTLVIRLLNKVPAARERMDCFRF